MDKETTQFSLSRRRLQLKQLRKQCSGHPEMKPSEMTKYEKARTSLRGWLTQSVICSSSTLSRLTLLRVLASIFAGCPHYRKYQYYRKYAIIVDIYVLVWLFSLIFLSTTAYSASSCVRLVLALIAAYRLIEICAYAANTVLGEPGAEMFQSYRRTVVLAVVNFVEVAAAFSVIYAAGKANLSAGAGRNIDMLDPFYFSIVTQLTVGYGDITPTGWLRGVTMVQSLTGTLLLIGILARFVSLIRAPGVMDEYRRPS